MVVWLSRLSEVVGSQDLEFGGMAQSVEHIVHIDGGPDPAAASGG